MANDAPLKIELSKQAKMFAESLDDEERMEFLDILEKLATGELVGEPVRMEDLDEDTRKQIEAASREPKNVEKV
jgi:hypothetical protein